MILDTFGRLTENQRPIKLDLITFSHYIILHPKLDTKLKETKKMFITNLLFVIFVYVEFDFLLLYLFIFVK